MRRGFFNCLRCAFPLLFPVRPVVTYTIPPIEIALFAMNSSPWQFHETVASLIIPGLQACVDAARPAAGLLSVKRQADVLQDFDVLSLRSLHDPECDQSELVECYVRGDDFIATYREGTDQRLRSQVYWRALKAEQLADGGNDIAGVDVFFSVQAETFDCQSNLSLVSWVKVDEVLSAAEGDSQMSPIEPADSSSRASGFTEGSGLVLLRLPGQQVSYAELIDPADFEQAQTSLHRASDFARSVNFFPQPLEKGVIHRARIRSLLLPRENDTELALACYRQMISERPSLTV